MSGAKVQVAVNGCGVIGKRVADAVALQDDRELIRVAAMASHYPHLGSGRAQPCGVRLGPRGAPREMDVADIQVAGMLDDLLGIWQGHLAASPVTTICDGRHDRSRPALGTGWRV